MKLFEAIPVSEDDRINIKVNEINTEPDEKDWDDRRGIWLWELELGPQEEKEIQYAFTIEHPREMQIEGL